MTNLDTFQKVPEFPIHYRIRLACEMAGVEVEDLATVLDVHTNTVHNYLAGRSKPKRPALKAIAERTRVSLEWLETGHVAISETVSGWYLCDDDEITTSPQVTGQMSLLAAA